MLHLGDGFTMWQNISRFIYSGYILVGEAVVMAVELGVRCETLKYLNKLQNPENSSIRC